VEDLLHVQVVLRGRTVAQVVCLGGPRHMRSVPVELGVHGHARHAELIQRAHDTDRYLAAVGDQYLLEHRAGSLVKAPEEWGQPASVIIPAPTVRLLDSSIRMKLPVRRLLV